MTKQSMARMAAIVLAVGLLLASEGFAVAAGLEQVVRAKVDVIVGESGQHVFVYVANLDTARQFEGVVSLRHGPRVSFILPPMSADWRDFKIGHLALVDGYDIQGRLMRVWPESATYEVVRFVPGWRYATLHVVARDVPAALEEIGEHCERVYKGRLNGFQVFVYPPEARAAAEAKDIDEAWAVFRRNFRSGLCYRALKG
ncbi:MAG: DUF429 domain-containing protein [Bacillota bacterium]